MLNLKHNANLWHNSCWIWVLHKFQDIECSTIDAKFRCIFGDVWNTGSVRVAVEDCVVGLCWCIVLAKLHLSASCCRTIQPMILDQNYIALKTQVIKAERRVLKELGFCVHVKHPHKVRNFDPFGCQLNLFYQSLFWSCIPVFVMWSLVRFSCVFVQCYWELYSNCWFGVTIISFQNISLKKKFVIKYSIDTIRSLSFSVCCVFSGNRLTAWYS